MEHVYPPMHFFAAFRLSSANGFQLPKGYGNACTWGHIAKNQGYPVNKTPNIGAIAWFDKTLISQMLLTVM